MVFSTSPTNTGKKHSGIYTIIIVYKQSIRNSIEILLYTLASTVPTLQQNVVIDLEPPLLESFVLLVQ